jgi:hypothetical protein
MVFNGKPGTRINKPATCIWDVSNPYLPIDYIIRLPGSILIIGNGSTYMYVQVLHKLSEKEVFWPAWDPPLGSSVSSHHS